MDRNELADRLERNFTRDMHGDLENDDCVPDHFTCGDLREAIAALRDVGVTDAMVEAARSAYYIACGYTTGEAGMRAALEAALSPRLRHPGMRGRSELPEIA